VLLGREVPEYIGVGMPVTGFRVSSPDAFLNTEVSRLHAKVIRQRNGDTPQYSLVDMRSTCGTYLNGDAIPVPDDLDGATEEDCAARLTSGDFFSLGPSNVTLFLFFQK
jgi:pSer/pThr/pTyr-binding forkhead associated (FHA) protein